MESANTLKVFYKILQKLFLADRNLSWFIVGASIFATNIGSEHLVGLAGSGATDGVSMAHYEHMPDAFLSLVGSWFRSI